LESSLGENTKLLELAKGSYNLKTASIAAKRQKMELKAEQEREGQRYASKERALVIKERMQEKEFEHREHMMKYELELARLKGQASQVPDTIHQSALSSNTFSPVSGSFGHDMQAVGIYATPSNSTFDNFTFPAQRSSVTPSPGSDPSLLFLIPPPSPLSYRLVSSRTHCFVGRIYIRLENTHSSLQLH
jgi:hypothetical protein